MEALRTHDYRDFSDPAALNRVRRETRATVSVVVPARNESETIGAVLNACAALLSGPDPLVHELVVMDGGSTDTTCEIASSAGARVVDVAQAHPSDWSVSGKGVALWKSQFVTSGDIILFLDADVSGFDSRFVTGLLGPLLRSPEVLFTKAAYRRPYARKEHGVIDDEGGRVTEILARPLLAAWYPQLACIAQPLAGEYALRRSLMRSLPFTAGYGVELLLLLEFFRSHEPGAFAQVDMGIRLHRNRTVEELGRMAFGIYQVFHDFMLRDHSLVQNRSPLKTMPAIRAGRESLDVAEMPLPPASTFDHSGILSNKTYPDNGA